MVGLMHGDVGVTSKYGEGSVFTVSIPQEISSEPASQDAGKQRKLSDAITYTTPDCRYLIVDDNKLNIVVAKRFLERLNGQIDTAQSGEEALLKMKENKYDLIFMDHMMPELDGIQTYERSLEDPDNINAGTPVIMMTANALSGVREEYLNVGFADYISKPVEIKEILRVVKDHVPEEKQVALDKAD
jgi:CheY-like chemotaxis protein